MKHILRYRTLFFFITGMFFVFPAIASPLTQKERTVIDTLFAKTKPQCIGRYIIDVPESFNNQLFDMVFIDDFKIQSKFLYPPAFKQRIQLREQELRDAINKPGNKSENAPFLKEVINLPGWKGVIFDRNESGTPDIYRKLEAHIYVNMISFIITTDIRDFSGAKNHEKKLKYLSRGFTEYDANTKPQKLAAMQSLIERLSGRNDHDIPQGKGVCIPNGFIKDDGLAHIERITFSYKTDDFIFGVYTNSKYKGSDDTLFSRSAEIDELLRLTGQYTIKKYALSPDGINSQAWLSAGKQVNRRPGEEEADPLYDFELYANEADATPARPWLKMRIGNEGKNTAYSETEMVEIWDWLVNSLRYK